MKHTILSGKVYTCDQSSRINIAGHTFTACQITLYDDDDPSFTRPLTLRVPCDIVQAGDRITLTLETAG